MQRSFTALHTCCPAPSRQQGQALLGACLQVLPAPSPRASPLPPPVLTVLTGQGPEPYSRPRLCFSGPVLPLESCCC